MSKSALKKRVVGEKHIISPEILENSLVHNRMRSKWDKIDDEILITPRLKNIFDSILDSINDSSYSRKDKNRSRALFYYGVVATFALLLSIGGFFFDKPINSTIQTCKVRYVITTGMQRMERMTLPDGSIVKMGPGSKISYLEGFVDGVREVELNGQAFFSVKSNPSKPFVVKTNSINVTALGTCFEVFSYEGDSIVETILLSGKVNVETVSKSGIVKECHGLSPNQKINYNTLTKRASVQSVQADRYTQWRNRNNPTFENEKLSVIIPRLMKWYGVSIDCPDTISNNYRFTFTVHDEQIAQLLSLLKESSPVESKYNKITGRYELYKEPNHKPSKN